MHNQFDVLISISCFRCHASSSEQVVQTQPTFDTLKLGHIFQCQVILWYCHSVDSPVGRSLLEGRSFQKPGLMHDQWTDKPYTFVMVQLPQEISHKQHIICRFTSMAGVNMCQTQLNVPQVRPHSQTRPISAHPFVDRAKCGEIYRSVDRDLIMIRLISSVKFCEF